MNKSVNLFLSAVKSAGEAALRLHEENESLRQQLAEANLNLTAVPTMCRRYEARLADAEREARVLVVAMADQFGAPDNWKPLPDAAGMITQISNMVAGLRKDAERYRWLRDEQPEARFCTWAEHLIDMPNEDFDAAIDAARAGDTGEKA